MKRLLIIFTCMFASAALAQNANFAIIRGHVQNPREKFWEGILTGYYFSNNTIPVNLDDNGNFNQKIRFDGDVEYLYLNNIGNGGIPICLEKNDTITINWDMQQVDQTLSIKNSNIQHYLKQQTLLELYRQYRTDYLQLASTLYTLKISDSAKFAKINDLYNREIETLINRKLPSGNNELAISIYYKYIGLAEMNNVLFGNNLTLKDTTGKSALRIFIIKDYYKVESEEAFRLSPDYREFLFNYLRNPKHKALMGWSLQIDQSQYKEKVSPFSPKSAHS